MHTNMYYSSTLLTLLTAGLIPCAYQHALQLNTAHSTHTQQSLQPSDFLFPSIFMDSDSYTSSTDTEMSVVQLLVLTICTQDCIQKQ